MRFRAAWWAMAAILWTAAPVSAYLDPATGSILWQVLVSAFLGIAFGARIFWAKIKVFFARFFGQQDTAAAPDGSKHGE